MARAQGTTVQGRDAAGAGTRFLSTHHVIGKSRLVQPAPPCDEREGLNFKSPSKVRKTLRPSLRLLALPVFRVLALSRFQGPRATHKTATIGIYTEFKLLFSLNTALLFLSSRAAYAARFTRC